MNFSLTATINRLFAPRHELSCSWLVWRRLAARLRQRGRKESRESGAFLLGFQNPGQPARIVDFVLYEDLDPHSLDTGIIRFDGGRFGKLWAIRRRRRLKVVADVHVHPGGSGESASDKAHPMITQADHLALILPDFGRLPMSREEIGIYRYLGDQAWRTVPRIKRRIFFLTGL